MSYSIFIHKSAKKDLKKFESMPTLKKNLSSLLKLIKEDPYMTPPSFEKLVGDLSGHYSRRINVQHRLVYTVDEENKLIKIVSVWSHYENI